MQYAGAGLWELELAWATTVHKAQGSEARAVVLALAPSHRPLLTRRLLYTGALPGLLARSHALLSVALALPQVCRRALRWAASRSRVMWPVTHTCPAVHLICTAGCFGSGRLTVAGSALLLSLRIALRHFGAPCRNARSA